MTHRANAELVTHDHVHQPGGSAAHPSAPRCGTLAALRILALPLGIAAVRALPAHRITACSGAFNFRFKVQTLRSRTLTPSFTMTGG